MSNVCQIARIKEGRCQRCDHDLTIKPERIKPERFQRDEKAFIYCTNDRCPHSTRSHPTGQNRNRGHYRD